MNMVNKNPNYWPETNQLAIYKCGWGDKPRIIEHISSKQLGEGLKKHAPSM